MDLRVLGTRNPRDYQVGTGQVFRQRPGISSDERGLGIYGANCSMGMPSSSSKGSRSSSGQNQKANPKRLLIAGGIVVLLLVVLFVVLPIISVARRLSPDSSDPAPTTQTAAPQASDYAGQPQAQQ